MARTAGGTGGAGRVFTRNRGGTSPPTSSGPVVQGQDVGFLSNFWNAIKGVAQSFFNAGGQFFGGVSPGPGGKGTQVGPGGAAAVNPVSPASGSGLFGSVAAAVTDVTSFLQLVAWLFHPRNILRAVEFLVGMVLIGFGFWAAMQARGESREGFTTGEAALSRSGLGRVSRALAMEAGERRPPRKPRKPSAVSQVKRRTATAPHRTRREALRQRYTREQRVREREQRSKGKKK